MFVYDNNYRNALVEQSKDITTADGIILPVGKSSLSPTFRLDLCPVLKQDSMNALLVGDAGSGLTSFVGQLLVSLTTMYAQEDLDIYLYNASANYDSCNERIHIHTGVDFSAIRDMLQKRLCGGYDSRVLVIIENVFDNETQIDLETLCSILHTSKEARTHFLLPTHAQKHAPILDIKCYVKLRMALGIHNKETAIGNFGNAGPRRYNRGRGSLLVNACYGMYDRDNLLFNVPYLEMSSLNS